MNSPQVDKPQKRKWRKCLSYIFYNNKKGRRLKRLCGKWERKNHRLTLKKEANQLLDLLHLDLHIFGE